MRKHKILVVDDEMDMRTFLSTLLETKGYKPHIACDGAEGFEKAKAIKPALIILDVMMPEEGGIQLYRNIKVDETLKHIPVIMLSGIAKRTFLHCQNVLNAHLGHVVPEPEAYIEKPPEPEELLELAEKILKARGEKMPL